MKKTRLVATLTELPLDDGEGLRALRDVSVLEVRADLVGDLDPGWLRDRFSGDLLYTLRSRAEGGAFEGGRRARTERIAAQAEGFDLVDLEAARDGRGELLSAVPAAKRILSWHGEVEGARELEQRFARLRSHDARYRKLVPTAKDAADGLRALTLLKGLDSEDAVVFAGGPAGVWTRLLAPRLGSQLTYGALGERLGAPGQPTLDGLIRDYGLPDLPPVERLYGIVGQPVLGSLSPRIHNGAYRHFGMAALYVPFEVGCFGDFWIDVVESRMLGAWGYPVVGLSVTAPFKDVALAVGGVSSPRAQHIGAANTLVLGQGVWTATTTDPEGVVGALEAAGTRICGARCAVVGCGGAGRAAAYGLELAKGEVTLVNRGEARGLEAADRLALPFVPLDRFDPSAFDVIVQATSLGRADDPLPFDVEALASADRQVTVLDLVYGAQETPLLAAARAGGARTIDGRSVLLHQALRQFNLMTGQRLDPGTAQALLGSGTFTAEGQ